MQFIALTQGMVTDPLLNINPIIQNMFMVLLIALRLHVQFVSTLSRMHCFIARRNVPKMVEIGKSPRRAIFRQCRSSYMVMNTATAAEFDLVCPPNIMRRLHWQYGTKAF